MVDKFRAAFAHSVFMSHVRTEENFIKDTVSGGKEIELPPPPPAEKAPAVSGLFELLMITWRCKGTKDSIMNSLASAVFCSALLSLVWVAEMQGIRSDDSVWPDLIEGWRLMVRPLPTPPPQP